jgi:serine/threonine protein phosphatase PrpC
MSSSDESKPQTITSEAHSSNTTPTHNTTGIQSSAANSTAILLKDGKESEQGKITALREKKVHAAPEKQQQQTTKAKTRIQAGEPFKKEIEHCFDRCEEDILQMSRKQGTRDGSTAITVWIHGEMMYCANVGDSRCVLCRAGHAMALSRDHKPQDEDEKTRILAAGGEVRPVLKDRPAFCCFKAKKVPQGAERLWPGGFSVSRALGDIDYKDPRRGKVKVINTLIAKPDITMTSITKDDQFLVLGTDGLWDVMSNQDACDFVLKEVKKNKMDPEKMAEKMVNRAFQLGSEDNITVAVVFFTHHKSWSTEQVY